MAYIFFLTLNVELTQNIGAIVILTVHIGGLRTDTVNNETAADTVTTAADTVTNYVTTVTTAAVTVTNYVTTPIPSPREEIKNNLQNIT